MTRLTAPLISSAIILFSTLCTHAAGQSTQADPKDSFSRNGFYAGVLGGWAILDNHKASSGDWGAESEGGASLGVFAGYRFADLIGPGSLRTELEFSGLSAKLDRSDYQDGSLHENSIFWNGMYEFDQHGQAKIAPYIGMGIGYGKLNFDNYKTKSGAGLNDSDTVWGAQLIGGIDYAASSHIHVFTDVRYRHWDGADVTDSNSINHKIDVDQAHFNVGVSYQF